MPGGLDHLAVEGDVVLDERGDVAALRRGAHRLDLALEHRHVPAEALRRLLRRELLERGAHRVHLDELGVAERADARPAEGLGLDQPQQLEVAQRLAHRRLARPELAARSASRRAARRA